ncbi:MAG: DNA translocase FtsK 4TM domain-containing protein [Pseudomonadota bacterium]
MRSSRPKAHHRSHTFHERVREGVFLLVLAVAAYLLIALLSFSATDPGWSYVGPREQPVNLGGRAGSWFASVFYSLFGLVSLLVPVMLAWSGWLYLRPPTGGDRPHSFVLLLRAAGFIATLVSGCALATMHLSDFGLQLPEGPGGVLGHWFKAALVDAFSPTGTTLLVIALFLAGLTVFTGVSLFSLVEWVGGRTLDAADWVMGRWEYLLERRLDAKEAKKHKQKRSEALAVEKQRAETRVPPKIEPKVQKIESSVRLEKEKQTALFEPEPNAELPPLSLLDPPKPSTRQYSDESLNALSRLVELKLADFGVESEVRAVHPGPVVTLFELDLAAGTKASKVSGLAKDLARALSTISVRVVENIPGKTFIGLEIPNEVREMVYLSEVLRSEVYDHSRSALTLALGKNIAGNPTVADLARMPHVLIAGTTGSGKSVAINAMVLSLIYKARPDQVRMIMIDPKMLELSVYEGIPHLLAPVVTDMSEAANALRWCVAEMERRYKLMAALGVRNIGGYNKKIEEAEKHGDVVRDPLFTPDPAALLDENAEVPEAPALPHMPYIVVVVDEFADMIMVVGKKVEELIARLAQKARAAGIHLMLATQRPSVDVITGLIKANIPSRIAFQVSSRVDSRTILDQMGAEHLLGHGDMLYLPPGSSIPQRVHGAFVSDQEVHSVVRYLKKYGQVDYRDDVLQEPLEAIPGLSPEAAGVSPDVEDSDPLFDEAVRIVTESRRASISGVQRRLKIGYNRAARMIEEMERIGIVTPAETNGNRSVLAPPPPES